MTDINGAISLARSHCSKTTYLDYAIGIVVAARTFWHRSQFKADGS
jgi:hypothetical protein